MNLHWILERIYRDTGWEPGPIHRWLCRIGVHDRMPDGKCVLCRRPC